MYTLKFLQVQNLIESYMIRLEHVWSCENLVSKQAINLTHGNGVWLLETLNLISQISRWPWGALKVFWTFIGFRREIRDYFWEAGFSSHYDICRQYMIKTLCPNYKRIFRKLFDQITYIHCTQFKSSGQSLFGNIT